mmetsp:Transcript_46282/g.124829  ORF Transcript_46282/g.124829 Transcript_46282/m.124829 type:complete len:225 (-) Transcript_46282:324-998(-)
MASLPVAAAGRLVRGLAVGAVGERHQRLLQRPQGCLLHGAFRAPPRQRWRVGARRGGGLCWRWARGRHPLVRQPAALGWRAGCALAAALWQRGAVGVRRGRPEQRPATGTAARQATCTTAAGFRPAGGRGCPRRRARHARLAPGRDRRRPGVDGRPRGPDGPDDQRQGRLPRGTADELRGHCPAGCLPTSTGDVRRAAHQGGLGHSRGPGPRLLLGRRRCPRVH